MVTQWETWREGINQELGINKHTLLYIKEITIKDLLYSTRNYTQYFITSCKGRDSEKEHVCICTLIYTDTYIYTCMYTHICISVFA